MKRKNTGERLETFVHNETTLEHLHRYALACDLAKNKVVADIACGEGYGSYLLSKTAENTSGIDVDTNTIEKAKKKYKHSKLNFLKGDIASIPLDDHSIDLVVSFETLEHVSNHEQVIKEFKRILKREGILIISTPDKKNYSDIPDFKNPHHVKELHEQEFFDLMNANFKTTSFFQQNSFFSSLIITKGSNEKLQFYEGDFEQVQSANFKPLYHICVASEESIPQLSSSIFSSNKTLDEAFRLKMNKSLSYLIGNFLLWPLKKIFR